MKHFLLVAMVLSSTMLWAQEVPTTPKPVTPELPTEGEAAPPAEYIPRENAVEQPAQPQPPTELHEPTVEVQVPQERTKERPRTCRSWNLEIGFTNWFTGAFDLVGQQGEAYALNNFHSRYLALSRNYSTYLPGPFMVDMGVSVSGHNYAFEDNTTRVDRSNGESLEFINNTTVDGRPVISQLGVTHLNAYLVPMLDFGLRIGVGAYAGYRMSSATTLLFFRGDEPHLDRDMGNFYMKPFRYGLRAQVGVRRAQLFMNYDMDEVFLRDRGPRVRTFSFGLIL